MIDSFPSGSSIRPDELGHESRDGEIGDLGGRGCSFIDGLGEQVVGLGISLERNAGTFGDRNLI